MYTFGMISQTFYIAYTNLYVSVFLGHYYKGFVHIKIYFIHIQWTNSLAQDETYKNKYVYL